MGDKKYYTFISTPSNQQVVQRPGRLHAVVGLFGSGGGARIDDSHRFPAGTLNLNAASSNTIGHFGASVSDLDIGFNTGLVVAVSSNAQVTIVYE